jgi:hypothetical protein
MQPSIQIAMAGSLYTLNNRFEKDQKRYNDKMANTQKEAYLD